MQHNFQEIGVNMRMKLYIFYSYLTLEQPMGSKSTLFQICLTVLFNCALFNLFALALVILLAK